MAPIPQRLLEAAHSAPSADNSQPWRFIWDGRCVSVEFAGGTGHDSLFGAASPATLLAIGGVVENLYGAADHYGYAVRVDPDFEPNHEAGRYLKLQVEPPREPVPIGPAMCPILLRHTNRFAYRAERVPEAIVTELKEAAEPPARLRYFDHPAERTELAALAAAASRIRFQTRRLHEWFAHSLRFVPDDEQGGDGLDVRTLDLPPGGAHFLRFIADWRRMRVLNRVGASRAMAAIEARPLSRAPALVAVMAPADGRSCIAAGRLMARVWTRLNEGGLAVHPYFGVPDQLQRFIDGTIPEHLLPHAEALYDRGRRFFGSDPDESLHMLLRIGYPVRDPPRSRRKPLESVTDDRSERPAGSSFRQR